MKRAIFITARLGSSRLPKKHLLELQGMKCVEHCFERAKRSKLADEIILCTTNLIEDWELCELAKKHGVSYFRGSVDDKIDRWFHAAVANYVDVFATYDADDVLCSPKLIDLGFVQQEREDLDYIQWNEKELICGSFTYVISFEALKRVWLEKKTEKTEMAFDFFEKSDWCKRDYLRGVNSCYCRPDIRLTLDYYEDFGLFVELFRQFGRNIVNLDLKEVVQFIDENPHLLQINAHRHLDWKKNQERIIKESHER